MEDFIARPSSPEKSPPDGMIEQILRESRGRPVAALLRHAAREEITDARSALEALLTPAGRAAAEAFGSGLPVDRPVRIFHSPVERCRQTAVHMAEGFRQAGGRTGGVRESEILGGPYVIDPEALLDLLVRMDPRTFMQAWSGGGIDKTVLWPLRDTAVQTLQFILSTLEGPAKNALDIHVTHDVNIMIVLTLAWDLASDWRDWPGYLEGLLISTEGEEVTIRFRGRLAAIRLESVMPQPHGSL